jgi:hypothetical protein
MPKTSHRWRGAHRFISELLTIRFWRDLLNQLDLSVAATHEVPRRTSVRCCGGARKFRPGLSSDVSSRHKQSKQRLTVSRVVGSRVPQFSTRQLWYVSWLIDEDQKGVLNKPIPTMKQFAESLGSL